MLPELTDKDILKMIKDIDENIRILNEQCKRAREHKAPLLEPGCNFAAVFPNSRAELYKEMIYEQKNRKCDLEHMLRERKEKKNGNKKRTKKGHL